MKVFILSFLLVLVLSGHYFFELSRKNEKQEIIFYSINKHLALGLRTGNNLLFISDKGLSKDANKMQFHIWHHWWQESITSTQIIDFRDLLQNSNIVTSNFKGNTLLVWQGKRFLFYERPINIRFKDRIQLDYLVVRENVWMDKEIVDNNFSFHKVIVDGTNNWKTSNWIRKKYPFKAYILSSKGYFLEN